MQYSFPSLPGTRSYRPIAVMLCRPNGRILVGGIAQAVGLNVSIVTSASSDEEAYALLKGMGMPFNNR